MLIQDVQNKLAGLSSDYSSLMDDVNKALAQDDLVAPTADAVRDESEKLAQKWNELNESTALFYAK